MYIFHTTSGFKRPNISRNTRWNCNFSLPFKSLPPKLHVIETPPKNQDETVSIRSWTFHILAILLRTFQVNNAWVLKLLWPGKPALLIWQRNYNVQTVSFTKNYWTILRSLEAFLFQMNGDNSGNAIDLTLIGKCPLSVIKFNIEKKK